jgi:hypothetical protein
MFEKIKKNKKMIGIIAMVLVVVGIATAAVVMYLSNTTTASVEVKSPILLQQEIDGTGYVTTPVTLTSTFGGSTEQINYSVTNNANNLIATNASMVITEETSISCADFTSITWTWGTFNCTGNINANTVVFKSDPVSFAAKTTYTGVAYLTFNPGAIGNYTINNTIVMN